MIVIQPNFRYAYRQYFDDYTHRSTFTHVSLANLLRSKGLRMLRVEPRFLPYSMRESRLPVKPWLVRAYLRSPIRPWPARCSSSRRKADRMHGGKTVSVVFPAYNEEQYIRPAVEDFLIPDVVDEVLVVDNNSRDRTAAEAARPRARVVSETRQGYGYRAAARPAGGYAATSSSWPSRTARSSAATS